MRPGITGWEAVHEGESSTRREMAEKDLYYVRNWSLKLDWLVFYKTFQIVLGFQRPDDSVRAPKMTDDQIIEKKKVSRCNLGGLTSIAKAGYEDSLHYVERIKEVIGINK